MKYINKALLIEYLEDCVKYKELLSKVNDGKFDVKDYQQLCQSYISKEIEDFFCNGFFGSDTYDLRGARILRVFEDSENTIAIEVKKLNDKIDYGYFNGGWSDWKTVFEYLEEWTNEE